MDADRRKHPRTKVPDTVYARIKTGISVRVVDISLGGVQLELSGTLTPASECRVILPTSWGERIFQARVCRCRAMSVSTEDGIRMVYRAGLEFIEPSDEDLLAITSGLDNDVWDTESADDAAIALLAQAV